MDSTLRELIANREIMSSKECEYLTTSLLETLKKELIFKEQKVNDTKAAIAFLEQNPKFEEFSKLMTKLRQ